MDDMTVNSQITFMYFRDYEAACRFINETLGLEVAYDPGWACVWRTVGKAFIGAVKAEQGSLAEVGENKGVLISLTVEDVEAWQRKLSPMNLPGMTEIKHFPDIGLRSFFFSGPEGYMFEIQEFLNPELKSLF